MVRLPAAYLMLGAVSAHYAFTRLSVNDGPYSDHWKYIRQPLGPWDLSTIGYDPAEYSFWPLRDVYSTDIRCGRNASSPPFANHAKLQTAKVRAGDRLSLGIGPENFVSLAHPGPGMFYLAKAPDGVELKDWDADGDWFKIRELGHLAGTKARWEADVDPHSMNVTIPLSTPPGKYLLRTEHLFLLSEFKRTDFFVSCTHLEIEGPGGGTPEPTVKFPGAYDDFDISIWAPLRAQGSDLAGYVPPGPKVWKG